MGSDDLDEIDKERIVYSIFLLIIFITLILYRLTYGLHLALYNQASYIPETKFLRNYSIYLFANIYILSIFAKIVLDPKNQHRPCLSGRKASVAGGMIILGGILCCAILVFLHLYTIAEISGPSLTSFSGLLWAVVVIIISHQLGAMYCEKGLEEYVAKTRTPRIVGVIIVIVLFGLYLFGVAVKMGLISLTL